MNNKRVVLGLSLLLFNIVVFQQVIDSIRWLSKKRHSILDAVNTALCYLFILIISYALFIAQNQAFLRGIEIEPKNLPMFSQELAEQTYHFLRNFHVANSYGLFRSMTGVNGGRPELVIMGSNEVD